MLLVEHSGFSKTMAWVLENSREQSLHVLATESAHEVTMLMDWMQTPFSGHIYPHVVLYTARICDFYMSI